MPYAMKCFQCKNYGNIKLCLNCGIYDHNDSVIFFEIDPVYESKKDNLKTVTHFVADESPQNRTILIREIEFARQQNGEFKNIGEMWGALAIELDEVLDHIRDKSYDTPEAHYEMIQAAGILLRYVEEHGDKAEIAKRQEERHEKN